MMRPTTSAPAPNRDPHLQLASFIGRALLGLVLVLAVLASCTGCAPQPGTPNTTKGSGTSIAVFTDPDTGCQYLGMYGETVIKRVGADGYSHMGCKGADL